MPFFEDYVKDFTFDFYKFAMVENAGMHFHPQYELLVVLDNKGSKITVNGQSHVITQPFVALFAPFSLHHASFGKQLEIERYIYYFDDHMIEKHPDEFKDFEKYRKSALVVFTFSNEIADMLRPLHQAVLTNRKNTVMSKLLFLMSLHLLLTEKSICVHLHTQSELGQTNQIVRYITEHFAENLTAETVAEEFFISRSKLYRDFQNYTNISFRQFLIELRISKAKFLLISGLDSREVATAVGFDNESYFCQFFKRNIGSSPLQFAKQHRKRLT